MLHSTLPCTDMVDHHQTLGLVLKIHTVKICMQNCSQYFTSREILLKQSEVKPETTHI